MNANIPPPSYHQAAAAAAASSSSSPQQIPISIPNSRSFDAANNEIYRLATNQSNVNSSQALLRNRIKLQQQNLARSYLYHSSSLDLEPYDHNRNQNQNQNQNQQRSTSSPPPPPPSSSQQPPPPMVPRHQKRVHYANQTTTFSKSLNRENSPNTIQPPTQSSKPLRPAILPRQTSTTTPAIMAKPTTTNATNPINQSSSSSSGGIKFPNTSTTTTTTTTNGQVNNHQTTTNQQQQQQPPISLPRGGEEVLINGAGHHHGRSRSYQKPSSRHHYGKHLFTSSSIDVAIVAESGTKTENTSATTTNGNIRSTIDSDPSRNKNNAATTKPPSSSTTANIDNISGKNVSESTFQQMESNRQNKMVNINTNHQHHRPPTSQSNRSQSTTPLDRNFYHFQMNPTSLFDEDPGIMSEIETSATGFRRANNKIRSSLPIVRTPSKSQDRSMGLVFLQFRNETKRALLPNEITSIDTVKALFVRSFPRQLSMEYLDHPSVRIYIHDPNKNMFYELEDLRDVKDRCILRIYEQGVNGPQPGGGIIHQSLMAQSGPSFTNAAAAAAAGGGGGGHDGESYGYFSEPEFDSEYQSQHIHRKRFPSPIVGQSLMIGHTNIPQSQYYGTIMLPPQYRSATLGPRSSFFINQNLAGQPPPQPPTRNKPFTNFSQTLPRGTHLMNPNPVSAAMNPFGMNPSAQPPPKPQRNFPNNSVPQPADIIMIQGLQARSAGQPIVSPSPNTNESQSIVGPYNRPLPDRPYSVAGHYPNMDRTGARFQFAPPANTGEFSGYLSSPEHRPIPTNATLMSIQTGQLRASFAGPYPSTRLFDPNLAGGGGGGVSAAATVSAAIVPNNPNTYVARHPTVATNVIDDEARVRMQEMERKIASLTNVVSKALTTGGPKPPPPPKPTSLAGHRNDQNNNNNNNMSADNLSQLRQIRRKARDLRSEIRQLKRFTVQQVNSARETMKENCSKIQSTLSLLTKPTDAPIRLERIKTSINCDAYNEDALRLDRDLLKLEAQVEALRSNVINRRCRVNMSNVESMALILSRASKTVADLKSRYPLLAQNLKTIMSRELHEIEKEEKFLKEEPERLEHSLKRCKKLTGTLVTLKRLASVQEQRSSNVNASSSSSPSQLLQSSSFDKKDGGGGGSGDENSSSTTPATSSGQTAIMMLTGGSTVGRDPLSTTRAKKMQAWRRSAHFHQPICSHNYKIDLYRGFASMPTIEEPKSENVDDHDQDADDECEHFVDDKKQIFNNSNNNNNNKDSNSVNYSLIKKHKSFDADLMEPHTIIQVTPATPSSTDDSSTKTTTSNMLDNLLDELQTFTNKQSSIDNKDFSPLSSSSTTTTNRCSPFQRTSSTSGSFRGIKSINDTAGTTDSDTIVRKASRSKSYSSIRATSEPPGVRSRGSSIPDGRIDFDNIALLASTCGNAAAATAALLEKRFAQSRQELLEQRHQELLHKQRQLQEQYTRLQQLSTKRPISRGNGSGGSFLSDLKKTGSESNIVSKMAATASANSNDMTMIKMTTQNNNIANSNNNNSAQTIGNKMNSVIINPTGSLHNLATNDGRIKLNENGIILPTETVITNNNNNNNNTATTVRKTFETEIL
nr:serine-rich adhesin for platelets-like isoform X1 [Dermatophagoides farinae]